MIKLNFKDIKKQQAFMAIVRFFALMLIITIIARGLNSTVMPTVEETHAFSAQLTQSVSTIAALTAYGGEPVLLPSGILVLSVNYAAGEALKTGDCIAVFSVPELEAAVKVKTAELLQMNTQLRLLQKSRPADDFALKQAQQQLDEAYEKHKKAYESGDEYAIESAKLEAQAIEAVRNSALHSYELAQQAEQEQSAQSKAEAALLSANIEALQAKLEQLKALAAAQGRVCAPFDGIITSITLSPGEESRHAPIFIGRASEGLLIKGSAHGENAKKITPGMSITLVQGEQTDSAEILSVAADSLGGFTFEAKLNGTPLQPGSANAEIIISQKQYPQCLPSQSIRQDINGTFVYTLETQQTVLGEASVLVRTEIQVLESNGSLVAIKGALEATQSVVKSSDRPLSNGARVKLP